MPVHRFLQPGVLVRVRRVGGGVFDFGRNMPCGVGATRLASSLTTNARMPIAAAASRPTLSSSSSSSTPSSDTRSCSKLYCLAACVLNAGEQMRFLDNKSTDAKHCSRLPTYVFHPLQLQYSSSSSLERHQELFQALPAPAPVRLRPRATPGAVSSSPV